VADLSLDKEALSSPQIATVLGSHPGSLRKLQARVLHDGLRTPGSTRLAQTGASSYHRMPALRHRRHLKKAPARGERRSR